MPQTLVPTDSTASNVDAVTGVFGTRMLQTRCAVARTCG
jgi:hypothetical protein